MQDGFQLTFADAFAAFVPPSGGAWQSWSTLLDKLEASTCGVDELLAALLRLRVAIVWLD
jgi:hypothetical protein